MTTTKSILGLFLLIATTTQLLAQKKEWQRHSFAVHAGYANMLQGTGGLTNSMHSYERELLEGTSWDLQYYGRPTKMLGIGFIYSGFTSQGSHEEGSDHLYTHYFAPQMGLYAVDGKRFSLRLNAGLGGIFYRNNSEVFTKSRRTTGRFFAINGGVNAAFKLTRNWAIEANAQYIASSLDKMEARYHDETTTVDFAKGEESHLGRLNLSAGIAYSF